MGKTSNKSKQAWNAAHYTKIGVSVDKAAAAAFKAACAANGASVAGEISRFMAAYCCLAQGSAEASKEACAANGDAMAGELARLIGASASLRVAPTPGMRLDTRGRRRKALAGMLGPLQALCDAERDYLDRIPENFQGGERYCEAERCADAIEEAIGLLEDAY